MLHRTLLIKLKREHREGLNYVRLQQTAQAALMGAYGVQSVRLQHAADTTTQRDWDLCLVIDYVSDVDEQRSASDPVRLAFEERFLKLRAERVWSGLFSDD